MRRREAMRWIVLLVLLPGLAAGQRALTEDVQTTRHRVRAYRLAHERAILDEVMDFLSIPNVAADREAIRRNAEFLQAMLARRGIRAEILHAGDAPPAVYGELLVPNARHTIVFYAHYDGQPVNPAEWAGDPWTPVLRDRPLEHGGRIIPWSEIPTPIPGEWRLYARSASDDKSPIVALLAALDALRAAGISPLGER